MLFRTGARISQNLHIKIEDIDLVKGRIFIQSAKEGVSFYRYLDAGFLEELREYIKLYRLQGKDYLFSIKYTRPSFDRWTKLSRPMNRKYAGEAIDRYSTLAGIQYQYVDIKSGELRRRIHPHTTKYTFCSMAYDKAPSMLLVALTVGNKTIYPLMRSYIKVPTRKRHELAREVIDELGKGEIFQTPQAKEKEIEQEDADSPDTWPCMTDEL
jgi:integrase